jgi:hypothetical protein
MVIASNQKLDLALARTDRENGIAAAIPCWTGTIACHAKPGARFAEAAEKISSLGGSFMVYTEPATRVRLLFPVPEEHLGEADAVLVAEHPGYTMQRDGKDGIVIAAHIDIVRGLPASDGSYLVDPVHGIPAGDKADDFDPASRLLYRKPETWVGLVIRVKEFFLGNGPRSIFLESEPSSIYGVVVETPADAGPAAPQR